MNRPALATDCMGGMLPPRVAAARAAGFGALVVSASDLLSHPEGWDAAVACLRASGLHVGALRVVRDLAGLRGAGGLQGTRFVRTMLEACAALRTRLLVVEAPRPLAGAPAPDASAGDLRKLAMLAVPLGVRVAVQGPATSWQAVAQADCLNLGLCLAGPQRAAGTAQLDALEGLDIGRVFLVHLADGDAPRQSFPGEGGSDALTVAFVRALRALGYGGPWSVGARNDDHGQLPPLCVARRGFTAARWLEESVLHRPAAVPRRSPVETPAPAVNSL